MSIVSKANNESQSLDGMIKAIERLVRLISVDNNEDISKQLHYINLNVGFNKGGNRFEIGYGKKREGIFCVGGVCKLVPSSNGFSVNITSSF